MTATFSFTREPLDTGRGFPAFVPSDEERGQEEWAQFLRSGNWIEHDWTSYYRLMTGEPVKARPFVSHLCHFAADTIHRHGGLALEYGAGPGGGLSSPTLLKYPGTPYLISDLSTEVISQWRNLYRKHPEYAPAALAAFDACDMPLASDSIGVVSSYGGLSNIEGDRVRAIGEIHRVLEPGGLMIAAEVYVSEEDARALPPAVRELLQNRFPFIFKNYREECRAAGFRDIRDEVIGRFSTATDSSTVADMAREHGVELFYTQYLRLCTK